MTEAPEPAEEIVRARSACANCNAPMHGEFCYACGQPRKGMIRHLSGIIGDFLDSVFNLDSRTFRTVGPLYYKPGYLSNEYFAGRRTRYVTPLRLYVFLSVIAFLAVSLTTHVADNKGSTGLRVNIGGRPAQTLEQIDAAEELALAKIEKSRGELPDAAIEGMREGAKAGFDSERRRARRHAEAAAGPGPAPGQVPPPPSNSDRPPEVTAENPNPINVTLFDDEPWHPVTNPVRITWAGETINAWLNTKVGNLIENGIEANRHPGKFVAAMFSVAPQALLMVLPLFALLLKLFYLFKRRLYMEHLIVALHSHSFLCLSILLLVLLNQLGLWTAAWPVVPGVIGFLMFVATCWIPLYLLLAQKRIYHQGWPMTLIKFFMIGIAYSVLLSFGMVLNLIWALATL